MDLESTKRQGRIRTKNPAKKPRRKEPDNFDWRADPAPMATQVDSVGAVDGFRGIKKQWLIKYYEEQREAEQRATAAAAAAENDHRNAAEAPVEEVSEGPRPVGSPEGNNEPGQATAGLHEQGRRGEAPIRESPKQEEGNPVREKPKHTAGEQRKRATDASQNKAARGTAAVPSRRTSKQEAANRERGPHGARRDPRRKDGPRAEQPKAQVSHRSSERAADTNAAVQQQAPAHSQSDKFTSSPGDMDMEATQHVSPAGAREEGLEARGSLAREPVKEEFQPSFSRQRGHPTAPQPAHEELVAETRGNAAPVETGYTEVAASAGNAHGAATGLVAISPPPLIPVSYLDGDDKEQLGELDINQLDSFRDLWLTIRSAYSTRLPKGDLKLIYCDVDNDLMLYQDEPWQHFKLVARSLFLSRKN